MAETRIKPEKRVADLARKLSQEIGKLHCVPKALREQAAALVSGLDDFAEKHKAACATWFRFV